MAVATSSRRSYALDNLNRAGITEYFQGIISGDMVSETKPAPEIYRKACALVGSLPEQSLALEDALNGILSARQAGLIPILIPDLLKEIPEADTLAETRLPSLSDVISYIETHFYSVSTAIKSS